MLMFCILKDYVNILILYQMWEIMIIIVNALKVILVMILKTNLKNVKNVMKTALLVNTKKKIVLNVITILNFHLYVIFAMEKIERVKIVSVNKGILKTLRIVIALNKLK